jgi:hypothetical protein
VTDMCGKLSVVYASGAANLLDAEILWTTEDRQEAISQGQVPGGLMYAYDMDGARGSGHARGCLPHSPGDDRGGQAVKASYGDAHPHRRGYHGIEHQRL